jgi:hypothetical protein
MDDEEAISSIAQALVASVDLTNKVRLLGLYASNFLGRSENHMQLTFGLDAVAADEKLRGAQASREQQVDRAALRDAIDEIRRRFGRTSLGTAGELNEHGVDVVTQRGRHAFGPERKA